MRILIHILIAAALLCYACKNEAHEALLAADEIIEISPDTASMILEKIDVNKLNISDKAYYSLLKTEADIKNNVLVLEDSIILSAVLHYNQSPHYNKELRSSFYLAFVYFEQNKLKEAMLHATKAHDLANELHDNYWIAKSAGLISLILSKTYNYSEAETYSRMAADFYKLAGKIELHRYSLCDVAIDLTNQGLLEDGVRILDSISQLYTSSEALKSYANRSSIFPLLSMGENELVKQRIELIPEDDLSQDEYVYRSHIQESDSLKNSDLSKALRLSTNKGDSIVVYYARLKHLLRQERYKESALLGDSLLNMQSDVVQEVLRESAMTARSDYFLEKARFKQREASTLRVVSILILIIAFITIAGSYIMYRMILKSKKAEFESDISGLIAERNSHNEIVESLFKKQWQTLNTLFNDYFENGESDYTRKIILHNIEKELHKLRNPAQLDEIEIAVNKYLNNIVEQLRAEFPLIKNDDIRFIMLIYAGFSVRAVCMICGIKYKYYYLKKSRLIKRISESKSPRKDLFISKLK
ncbi:MAG: hypothetical protein K2L21_07170 [Muribaculaceae bacterium]|nr:hypothetical protein [Muribaculaceae bacterium]